MNPDDIARILDDLGSRIGPAGEYVFALAVRQAVIANALWFLGSVAVCVVAAFAAVRWFRGQRAVETAIGRMEATIAEANTASEDIRAKHRDFDREKQAADLAAMTEKQRKEWYDLQSRLFGFGGYYGDRPFSFDAREAHAEADARRFAGVVSAAVAVIALIVGLTALPGLLNPEYAALTDILSRIVP